MNSGALKRLVESRRTALVCLLLGTATIAAYWQVSSFEFTNYDDPNMILDNRIVRAGLTLRGLSWAFTTFWFEYWHPLTWLSHMMDCQLFGLRPGWHHLVSLGFHVANTLLLFGVLQRMTGAWKRSAMVAALFALHPLHVESVAWIAERKDVLSAFFFMLTLGAYSHYVEAQGLKSKVQRQAAVAGGQNSKSGFTQSASRGTCHASSYYVLALCCFAFGLMCKPMLVTLPFVLLLFDYWPLHRLTFPPNHPSNTPGAPFLRLLQEKLPFFALTVASCAITYAWAGGSENLLSAEKEPWDFRLANVPVSYARYLGKIFWPAHLAVPYPTPNHLAWWQTGGAVVVLVLISLVTVWRARSASYLIVGWLFFLGVLFPTIRLIQAGFQSIADRYTYLPSIGIFIAIVWSAAEWGHSSRFEVQSSKFKVPTVGSGHSRFPAARPAVLTGLAAVVLLLCGYLTRVQVANWRNSFTLWTHCLAVGPDNGVARCNLGNEFLQRGNLDEAVKQFREAIRLESAVSFPYNGLGTAYARQAKLDDAIAMFLKATTLDPGLEAAHCNLGKAYLIKGKTAEAIAELKTALRLKPDKTEAQAMLADALIQTGKASEALPYCEAVVNAEPRNAHAHFVLGSAHLSAKRLAQAVVNFKEALRLAPDAPECLNALAWIQATSPQAEFRNGSEAVRLAEAACRITKRQQTGILDTLAAAYAEAGRFDEAIKTTEEIRALAAAANDTNAVDEARQRLGLYQAGKPYRDE
jgi:tetratricopeptide (TPR) repeat protein